MVDYQHRLLCDKKSWAFVAGVDAAGVDAAAAGAGANKLERKKESYACRGTFLYTAMSTLDGAAAQSG